MSVFISWIVPVHRRGVRRRGPAHPAEVAVALVRRRRRATGPSRPRRSRGSASRTARGTSARRQSSRASRSMVASIVKRLVSPFDHDAVIDLAALDHGGDDVHAVDEAEAGVADVEVDGLGRQPHQAVGQARGRGLEEVAADRRVDEGTDVGAVDAAAWPAPARPPGRRPRWAACPRPRPGARRCRTASPAGPGSMPSRSSVRASRASISADVTTCGASTCASPLMTTCS